MFFKKNNVASPLTDNQRTIRGVLLISVAVLMLVIMDTIAKYLTRFYPVNNILWARFLFHTLLVVAVLSPRLGLRFMRTRRPGIQILRGVLLPIAAIFFIIGTKYMPIAEVTAITFVAPLIVTVLAVVFLKEKVERNHWLAILFGFVGVLVIIRPGSGVFTWVSLLPLGNALTFALYQVLTRRVAGLESAYTSVFYAGFVGLLILSLSLPFTWVPPQSFWHFALLALTGIIGGSGHLLLIKAYDHAAASQLAPFSYSQIVWATVMGYAVFGDLPDFLSLVGIALLATGGIYLATHLRRS